MDNFDQYDEALTVAQRAKAGRRLKLLAPKIARSKKIKQNRLADRATLEKRAQKKARTIISNRLIGGQKLSDMSPQQKIALSKKLESKKSVIKKLAVKLFKTVKSDETKRLKSLRQSKSDDV